MEVVWSPGWLHSALLIVMIVLILTGRRSGVFESRRRQKHEREGLRAALIAELTALHGMYRLNLELITAGSPALMPGRAYFSIYKGNMARLLTLTPPEVGTVVAAFAASELLDGAVHVGSRMRARRPEGDTWQARRFDVKRLHRAARAAAEEAVAALEEGRAAAAVQAQPWSARARAWVRSWRFSAATWPVARRRSQGALAVQDAP